MNPYVVVEKKYVRIEAKNMSCDYISLPYGTEKSMSTTYSIVTRVDSHGKYIPLTTKVEYSIFRPPTVFLELKDKPKIAQLSVCLSSDDDGKVPLYIMKKTPNWSAYGYCGKVGEKGQACWKYCEWVGANMTYETVWEVWSSKNKLPEDLLFSFSFRV